MFNTPLNNGFSYTMNRPKAQNTQPLTAEQAEALRKESDFDMKIDQKDLWRAKCTHKDPTTHMSTLVQNADGTFTCTTCGATFRWFNGTDADVTEAVEKVNDIMQTCKTIYLDMPYKVAEQYFQAIPILRKLAPMWNMAVRNFELYNNTDPMNPISTGYGSSFNALNNMLTNPYAYSMGGYAQQPMGYGAPVYPQQPMGYAAPVYPQQQMAYGAPVYQQTMPDMTGNPMGYNAPAMNVPAMPSQAPVAAPAPAPAAPVNQGEVQQQKQMTV